MTQEIIEGNKLIAEFMGAKPITFTDDFGGVVSGVLKMEDGLYPPYKLKYHSSWDWLMPVVEKMSRIKCVWDNDPNDGSYTYYPLTFGMLNDEGKPMVRFYSRFLFTADKLIEAAWLAVVDFIQHNNQSSGEAIDAPLKNFKR